MPIILSENPEDSKFITAVDDSGKVGPWIPFVEAHPIQVIGTPTSEQDPEKTRIASVVNTSVDLTMSYISNRFQSLLPTISSLPAWHDDITERFGPEIYDRMYKDSEIAASVDMLVAACTSQDIRFIPNVSEGDPGYKKSQRIADFFTWIVDEYISSISFDEVRASSVLSALKYGNNVTEMTFGYIDSGRYKGLIGVQSVRNAEIREYSLVVDNFNNVIGIIPAVNRYGVGGFTEQLLSGFGGINSTGDKITLDDITSGNEQKKKLVEWFRQAIVPRRKLILYAWRPDRNDPRGTSAIRAAYSAWWLKQQVTNEMLSWLEKFSQPSIVGVTPEGAQDQCEYDNNNNVISRTSPTTQLLAQLQRFQGSSALAVPFGTKIELLTATGQGQVFLSVLAYANQEISRAILKQHLATSEGLHQSRAASTVHQDILSLVVIGLKNWQKRTLMRDFVRPLIELNFGPDALMYAPKIDIGDGDGFPLNPFEVSQLQGVNWFSPSQMAEIDKLLGLPVRSETPQEIQAISNPAINTTDTTNAETSTNGGAAGDATT